MKDNVAPAPQAGVAPPPHAHNHNPVEVRAQALKFIAQGYSLRTVGVMLEVPVSTLRGWTQRYPDAIAQAREDHLREAESNLTVKLQALAEESVDRARKLIPDASYRDLITGVGVGTQRYSELRRGAPPPQVHVHLTREQLDSQLHELSRELLLTESDAEEEAPPTEGEEN